MILSRFWTEMELGREIHVVLVRLLIAGALYPIGAAEKVGAECILPYLA